MTNHLLDVQDLHVSFDTHVGEVRAVQGRQLLAGCG